MGDKWDSKRLSEMTRARKLDYVKSFYKETAQQSAFKKKIRMEDSVNHRKQVVKNTSDKLHKEGLLKEVSGFMKNALKVKGL